MARPVLIEKGKEAFNVQVKVGPHELVSDVLEAQGGADAGLDSHELLGASLGTCTLITVWMYAERKGWPLQDMRVTIVQEAPAKGVADAAYIFKRDVHLVGPLSEEQRNRLLEIADRCPIHKVLMGKIKIETIAG